MKIKVFFLLLVLALSCHFVKAQEQIDSTLDTLSIPPVATDYSWLSYRGKVDFTDTGGTRTCNFFMVNRTDSILYLNVHAYGIEVIRVVFTPDSVIYVNKLTNQYFKGSYFPLRVGLRYPIDFQTVQAIFTGNGDQLPPRHGVVAEYSHYVAIDSTRSFFTEMVVKERSQLLEFYAVIKNVRFDIPGPTSIRIPEKFEELKF